MRKCFIVCTILLFIFIQKISFAHTVKPRHEILIDILNAYFIDYYSLIKKEGVIKPEEQVFTDILSIIHENYGTDKELLQSKVDDIYDLTDLLNNHLKKNGIALNLFTINTPSIVNCWLGSVVKENLESKNIWGKEVKFKIKIIDGLRIKDFINFLSSGKESFDIGTRQETIYCNLEAYKIRANSIWDYFVNRGKKRRRYDPSKSNRLRKKLYYETWSNIYANCSKNKDDLEEARKKFIGKTVFVLMKNSIIHEAGHIFADKYLNLQTNTEGEIIALITELRFGRFPHESLDMVISASYQNYMADYNSAGTEIISEFIYYIENEQKNNNPRFRDIDIKGITQRERARNLYKLTADQIRSISEYIYMQKYENNRKL